MQEYTRILITRDRQPEQVGSGRRAAQQETRDVASRGRATASSAMLKVQMARWRNSDVPIVSGNERLFALPRGNNSRSASSLSVKPYIHSYGSTRLSV